MKKIFLYSALIVSTTLLNSCGLLNGLTQTLGRTLNSVTRVIR